MRADDARQAAIQRLEKVVTDRLALLGSDQATGARRMLIDPDQLEYARPNTNLNSYPDWEFRDKEPFSPRLKEFYNKYKGERCFIIGNGPSLNRHDLSLLENEYSFGVNSIYYKTRDTGFMPTFFVVEDDKVMEENYKEFIDYHPPFRFFPTEYKKWIPETENTIFFKMNHGFYQDGSPYFCLPRFSADATRGVYCGQTVTYINLQLAFFMGFAEVFLIGMDFDYVIPDSHKRTGNLILSTSDDPNHFHKDYFGVGKTWKDPKLDRVAMNYRQARVSYEAVGRRVFNATIGGKLELFERVDYESLFTGGPLAVEAPRVEPVAAAAKPSPVPSARPATVEREPSVQYDSARLASLKDRHKGEHCFIMGNGPSLNEMDLSKLAGETVFACNGVDLLFDRIDWRPTYYVSVDSRVLPDRASIVSTMLATYPEMTGFFPAQLRDHGGGASDIDTRALLKNPANAVFFNEVSNSPDLGVEGMFSLDVADYVVQPYTVAITMMQLAAWMGFSEIILIGCDTDYSIPDSVDQQGPEIGGGKLLLTSTLDDDPNHFDPRYFGAGRRWHQPQVDKMIEHYRYAHRALERSGVTVINATVGGRLEVFDRVDYGSLWQGHRDPSADLLIVGSDAAGRAATARAGAATTVMVVGDATDVGEGLKADYLVAAGAKPGLGRGRLEELVGERAGLRRVLLSADQSVGLGRSDRAIIVDPLARILWQDYDLSKLSATEIALLWGETLGYRSMALAGEVATQLENPDGRVVDDLRRAGVSIARWR